MKHLFSIYLLLAALLVSCSKQEAGNALPPEMEPEDEKVEVIFSIDGGSVMDCQTKTTTLPPEATVENFQILVYNPNGKLDGYGHSSSSGNLSVKVTRGTGKKCYAVVNSTAELDGQTSESMLLQWYSSLPTGTTSGFEMLGMVEKDLTSSTSCQIPVTRFVAKVSINKISTDFSTIPAYDESGLKIKRIYLINVRTKCPFTFTQTAGTGTNDWYNKLAFEYSMHGVIGDDDINAWADYDTPHYFYCMPNPVTEDTQGGSSFTPRFTRLVIEADLAGSTYYYPINIVGTNNKLDANTSYEITNLTITGIGSDSPDVVPKKGSVSFSVKVTDWATGFSKQVEY